MLGRIGRRGRLGSEEVEGFWVRVCNGCWTYWFFCLVVIYICFLVFIFVISVWSWSCCFRWSRRNLVFCCCWYFSFWCFNRNFFFCRVCCSRREVVSVVSDVFFAVAIVLGLMVDDLVFDVRELERDDLDRDDRVRDFDFELLIEFCGLILLFIFLKCLFFIFVNYSSSVRWKLTIRWFSYSKYLCEFWISNSLSREAW